jgi:uncharacterized protein
MVEKMILWQRVPAPGHEFARLAQVNSQWEMTGTALLLFESLPCRLDYQVICDTAWHTRSAQVSGWIGDQRVEAEIFVDEAFNWLLNGVEQPQVTGCIDLDLNFSPVTNTLPIRRLGLAVGQSAEVKAAWLRFPSFRLEPLEQVYQRMEGSTYRYESAGGSFTADLSVNEVGLVTHYPGQWTAAVDL